MTYNRNTIIILLLLFVKSSFSQVVKPYFNIVRGIKNYALGKVVSMAQDKYGYMWLDDQSNSNLVRYDGYHMKIFHNNPSDTNSVAKFNNDCIAADHSGNIWIPVLKGVDKYDYTSNKFIHYRFPAGVGGFGYCMIIDHSGIVWIGGDGLARFDPATGKFTHFVHSNTDTTSLSCNIVRSLYEDKAGILWVGTGFEFDGKSNEGGLNRFNKETGTFTRYIHDPNNPNSLAGNKVRALFEDSKHNFWVGTDNNGLHLMDREKGTFERYNYDPLHPEKLSTPPVKIIDGRHHITFITEDITHKLWIGTYSDGIICYNPLTKRTDHFNSEDKKRPGGYTDNSSWAIYSSIDGELWISNEKAELFRVDPYQSGFTEEKMENTVDHFLEDSSGNLWLNTVGNGLKIKNKNTGEKKQFLHNSADSFSISSNMGTFLKQSLDGNIWVGTLNGLNLFNPQTNKFTHFFYNPKLTDNGYKGGVFNILETRDETYYGLYGKLAIKNNNTNIITYYVNNPDDTNSISIGGPIRFKNNFDGTIWISMWDTEKGGLDLFNTTTKKFKHYFKGLIIWDIFKSSAGKMWVGTSDGLYYRNDSLDTFIQAGPEYSELRKSKVKSMTEDEDKNIWGVSTLGIFRLNPSKNQIKIFGDKYGTIDVGTLAYEPTFRTSGGEIFFGNPHGYYICTPKEVFNSTIPQVVLTDFKIDDHSLTNGSNKQFALPLEDAKEIILNHNQNTFSIDFAAIHFADPENNMHMYMMEGIDKEWRDVHDEKSAYYFNIPPGHYTFRLKTASSYGVNAERSIIIKVLPPWWQTWWAYTLYALILILAIWSFIKWRTKKLEKETIVLEKRVAERTLELKREKEIVESTLGELKSAQAQLIQSEKMASLGELTAGIAHEIQNPLNFVNNFSEINQELLVELKDEAGKGNIAEVTAIANDVISNEEKINHHGKRADAIVKGMLQHSRSSSGQKEPTDVNALADEYLRLAFHGIRAKDKSFNAEFKTDFDSTIGKINLIPQDVGRVLLNLYNNAFYAVNEKKKRQADGYEPTVSVSTKKMGDKVEIKVADNGNGIPQKVVDKIFQPFFTTKPTGEGTGLGLSLSYDIIKAHGGEIKLSTKELEGSDFVIILPAKS